MVMTKVLEILPITIMAMKVMGTQSEEITGMKTRTGKTVMMEEMMITEMIIVVMALWTSVLMALWTSRPIHTSMLRKSSWRREEEGSG
jgi:hypothetical protein